MKSVYLVVLMGQGDTIATVVDAGAYDWIVKGGDLHGEYRDLMIKEHGEIPSLVEGSSPDNDRALALQGFYGPKIEETTFWDIQSALEYVRNNSMEIVNTYEGVIY